MVAVTCQETVYEGLGKSHTCDRKIKGEHNGIPMCGVHLRAAQNRTRKYLEWEQADLNAERETGELKEQLRRFGIEAEHITAYGGVVIIHKTDWTKLADVLRGVEVAK